MVYASLPTRRSTPPWRRAAPGAVALLDGARLLLAALLVGDAVRSLWTGDPSILGVLVRWPGGRTLPAAEGVLLGAALVVRHRLAALVLVAHAALVGLNLAEFYVLRAEGLPAAALPFSVVTLALLLAGIARTFYDGPAGPWIWTVWGAVGAGPALLVVFLLAFGSTDYARPAEAIVVFGARVDEGGEPSLALEDRVRHGIRLYQAGLAPKLILSGAPDEVRAMERLARAGHVPGTALAVDPLGLNTYATIAHLGERRVVAVSHYYHLARIKLAAARRGIACATVPCPMTRRLAREPFFVARECAALLDYYLLKS